MKTSKCLMGILLSSVLLIGSVFAGNALSQDVKDGIINKGQASIDIRSAGEYDGNSNRDCTDCEFDFTPYGSECCDSAWDEFGIDCMNLEANYNWDCSGCLCPGDGEAVCGDGFCSGDETYETCPSDCNAPGECDAGQILDCDGSDECWPESWIGDGFADCQDQQYGADLTCYDCDGGDCPESDPGCGGTAECGDGYCNGDETEESCPEDCAGGGTTGGSGDCEDCEFDWSAYGSECCDTAWDEFGIDCATLESTYGWDCAGCSCPGDGDPVCGDGSCNGDETYETCPDDCNAPGECDAGYITDCVDDDCCPESWIGDGFEDCEDQAFGCDLTCYDNDGGDCPDCENSCGDGACNCGETYDDCPSDCNAPGECDDGYITDCVDDDCCPESWIGDGFEDCEDQAFGCDLTCYDNDGGDCPEACENYTCWDGSCVDDMANCPDEPVVPEPTGVCIEGANYAGAPAVTVSWDIETACGDGVCNGDEDYYNCPDDCNAPGECDDGYITDCAAAAADVNGDGEANVLDIVQIVNGILGGRVDVGDATSGQLIKSNGALTLEANGYIGGVQMTLSHDGDFSIDLTDKAMVAEYNTVGNETILVIVAPEGEELFTYTGDFEIVDMIIANSQDRVNVGAPTEFSLSTAYPNPFNPTTSLELSVPMNGQVTVQVYNLMGQVVATLANGYMDASTYTLTWDASNVSSGMYIVKAEAAGTISTQKLMLMK